MNGDEIINLDLMPVFLVNGFLEAGKTQFLQFTMEQDYFQTDGKTLLVVCEEGDTFYDEELLKRTRTTAVYVGSLEEMAPQRLEELELLYQPQRVLIEWNGMWDLGKLRLPGDWALYQQITIIDMSTFELHVKNMKPLLAAMVRGSELVVCNRCDGILDLSAYRRIIKAWNQKGDIVFEDASGEVCQLWEESLPYDLDSDVIQVEPGAYGIWYLDCLDRPERYQGKVVEFTAMVLKSKEFPPDYFVPGRLAITCCQADMNFLGFVCKAKEARNLETKQWVRIRAKVAYEFWKDYGGKGPVLYAESVDLAKPIPEPVEF